MTAVQSTGCAYTSQKPSGTKTSLEITQTPQINISNFLYS